VVSAAKPNDPAQRSAGAGRRQGEQALLSHLARLGPTCDLDRPDGRSNRLQPVKYVLEVWHMNVIVVTLVGIALGVVSWLFGENEIDLSRD
jgi:hypothetical protein